MWNITIGLQGESSSSLGSLISAFSGLIAVNCVSLSATKPYSMSDNGCTPSVKISFLVALIMQAAQRSQITPHLPALPVKAIRLSTYHRENRKIIESSLIARRCHIWKSFGTRSIVNRLVLFQASRWTVFLRAVQPSRCLSRQTRSRAESSPEPKRWQASWSNIAALSLSSTVFSKNSGYSVTISKGKFVAA